MAAKIVERVNELARNLGYTISDLHAKIEEYTAGQTCDVGGKCVGKMFETKDVVFRIQGHCCCVNLDAKFKGEDDTAYVNIHRFYDH
jgi:hypothetical protein